MNKIIALICALFFCTSLYAENMQEIIFFGDSLSDNGNLLQLLKTLPKSPPYFKGRFTNGLSWSEYIEKRYYDDLYIDSQIYAYGGATAIMHSPLNDQYVTPITLSGELYQYYLNTMSADKTHVLYSIWIGANDYLYDNKTDVDTLTSQVVNGIESAVNQLAQYGGQNFLLVNLPDLGRTPYARKAGHTERLHNLSMAHNQKLDALVKRMRAQNPNQKLAFLDIFTPFNGLLDNPAKYNAQYGLKIKDTTEGCWQGTLSLKILGIDPFEAINNDLHKATANKSVNFNIDAMAQFVSKSPMLLQAYAIGKAEEDGTMVPCKNASEHVFWDDVHPTAPIHEIVAKLALASLTEQNILF